MAILPKINQIQLAIESGKVIQENRPYIGYSGIGHKCKRYIWLNFRWAFVRSVDKRIARIFERGDWEEERIIRDLRSVGVTVTDQQLEMIDNTGHVCGHIDGIVSNVAGYDTDDRMLLELKTMNDKRFSTYLKEGIKSSDPEYYVQMNMYMGKLGLQKCLFIVTNKNNEQRDYQVYDYDPNCFDEHENIAIDILTSEFPPDRIGHRTYYACKMCSAYEYCQKREIDTAVNCRTCKHSDILMDGKWSCGITGLLLSTQEQRFGVNCIKYEKSEVFE